MRRERLCCALRDFVRFSGLILVLFLVLILLEKVEDEDKEQDKDKEKSNRVITRGIVRSHLLPRRTHEDRRHRVKGGDGSARPLEAPR